EAEQDGLEGEEVGEDREKERSPESWQGRRRRQRGGEADQERHAVLFIGPDDEGEGGEDGEAQHAHGADNLGGRELGRGRTSRRMRALEGRRGQARDENSAMSDDAWA